MTQNISLVIIDSDADSLNRIVNYVKQIGDHVEIAGVATGFEQGFELVHKKRPTVLIMEAPTHDMIRSTERVGTVLESFPQLSIFVTCEDRSSEAILKFMRAGAAEYILRPVDESDLDSALQKTGRLWLTKPAEKAEKGYLYAFFGPKGGVGVTTIATNVAVDLYAATKKPTILVDLDFAAGDVTTFLNMRTTYTISDVTSNISRLDESFLKGVITKHDSGIYVLSEPQQVEEGVSIPGSDIRKLFTLLKTMFTHIVVDAENVLDERTMEAIEASDMVLMVFFLSLPGIKHTQRHLRYFDKVGIRKDKIKLVVNRYVKHGDILVSDAEKVLKHDVFWSVPNDYEATMAALNKGVPIRECKSASIVSQSIEELARTLLTSRKPNTRGA